MLFVVAASSINGVGTFRVKANFCLPNMRGIKKVIAFAGVACTRNGSGRCGHVYVFLFVFFPVFVYTGPRYRRAVSAVPTLEGWALSPGDRFQLRALGVYPRSSDR